MILFADNFNFKRENFPALFDFIIKGGASYSFDDHESQLKKSWGKYSEFTFAKQEFQHDYDFSEIAKDEFLSAFLGESDLLGCEIFLEDEVFDCLKKKYPKDYELCMQAAYYWVSYWVEKLKKQKIDIIIVFGGNLIYSKSLLRVAEVLSVKCFVTEHFYTGNDFYLENRYTAIPNNSFLRSKRFIRDLSKENFKFLRKIVSQENKNVKQPAYASLNLSDYVLLLAQVPNDFSILSSPNKWKNSIFFYKKIIEKVLNNSDKNVVVKVHPYERVKNKDKFTNTYDELKKFISLLPDEQALRVHLYENYSIEGLVAGCEFAITLNSQAGLDVVRFGRQIVCFGDPFYGKHGFTHDFSEIDDLDVVLKYGIDKSLHFKEYSNFLSAAFDHLVGTGEVAKVEKIFKNINISKKSAVNIVKKADALDIAKVVMTGSSVVVQQDDSISSRSKAMSGDISSEDRRKRLLRKFKKDPKRFLEDSKNPLFRFFGKVI